MTINLNSMVGLAITDCLDDFHDIIAPLNVNTNLLADFGYFISNIHLLSPYPLITTRYFV